MTGLDPKGQSWGKKVSKDGIRQNDESRDKSGRLVYRKIVNRLVEFSLENVCRTRGKTHLETVTG